jgi:predicted  nucleic acid-binding Zn-ribbon protein
MGDIAQTSFEEWKEIYRNITTAVHKVEEEISRVRTMRQEYAHRVDNQTERLSWVFFSGRHSALRSAYSEVESNLYAAHTLLDQAVGRFRWILDNEERNRSGRPMN